MARREDCIPISELEIIDEGGSFSSFMTGLLFGGLIGAAAILLSAPQSGVETRQMLRDKSIELRDQAKDMADQARTRVEDVTRQGSERISEMAQKGEEILKEQQSKIQSATEGVRQGARSITGQKPEGQQPIDAESARISRGEDLSQLEPKGPQEG